MAEQQKDPVKASDFNLINATPVRAAQLEEALAYLQQSPKAGELLAAMQAKDISIRFVDANDGAKYHPEASTEIAPAKEHAGVMTSVTRGKAKANYPANTIDWNPNVLLFYTNAEHSNALDLNQPYEGIDKDIKHQGVLSPALMLIHEGGHALDKNHLANRDNTDNKIYENDAEQYAAKKAEHPVALELGEGVRENHGGAWRIAGSDINLSPTLHTVAYNPIKKNAKGEEILQWQQQHLAGAMVVTGGMFTRYSIHDPKHENGEETKNTIPDLGTYSADNNTLTLNNVNITLNQLKQDLTIQGNGNTLDLSKQPLPKDISIVTQGRFIINDGEQQQTVSGTNRLSINPAGDLVITAEKATQAVSNQQDYQQLAQTFNDAIKHPTSQTINLSSQQQTALHDSLAFYNAASTQLPAPVVKQIGNNLLNEIKAGKPLQLAANQSLVFNTEVNQVSIDDVEL